MYNAFNIVFILLRGRLIILTRCMLEKFVSINFQMVLYLGIFLWSLYLRI